MQVCTSLQTDNHASTPPLSFLQAACPSCRPSNSVKALKANTYIPVETVDSNNQWCIAKNGGGYTQTGVAKGLKVPCLFMIA